MSLVETLDLKDSLPVMSNDNFGSPEIIRVIHLSRLSALCFSSTAFKCAYLLNHISYPTSTSLKLYCTLGIERDCLPTLFKAVSSVWNGRDGSQLLDTLMISRDKMCISLRGWTTSGRVNGNLIHDPAQVDITLHYVIGEQIDEEMTIDICNALTLTNLQTLFIHTVNPIPASTFLNAFGSLASLRMVYAYGRAAIGFVSALSTGLEENSSEDIHSSDGTRNVFFPGLQNLWFAGLTDNSGPVTFNNMEVFEDLRDCLMNRCHWNVDLRKLRLDCPRTYYDQIRLLGEIVVDIEWRVVHDQGQSQ
jgi:hypothetical protein